MPLPLRAAFLVLYCSALQAAAQPVGIATAPDAGAPRPGIAQAPAPQTRRHGEHSLPAFGGLLIGTDRGEWIGRLQFQDPAGGLHTLLEKNVLGIVSNDAGIFVFTGLDHMSLNEGQIYVLKPDAGNTPHPELLARLPGTPGRIRQEADGTIRFLVFTGQRDQQGRFVPACYQLAGHAVSRAAGCRPLQPAADGQVTGQEP